MQATISHQGMGGKSEIKRGKLSVKIRGLIKVSCIADITELSGVAQNASR